MDAELQKLDKLLTEIQLVDPPYEGSVGREQLYQDICGLLFDSQRYQGIWSEPTLNRLERLFATEKPDELFRTELEEISRRAIAIREINDFFFGIVDQDATTEELCKSLSKIIPLPADFGSRLDASRRLQEIRNQDNSTSAKVEFFLELLRDDYSVDLTRKEPIRGSLSSLKSRETEGKVLSLLVKETGQAIAASLHIKLQPGSGQVLCHVKGADDFKDAVGRAYSAMREKGFLSGTEDVDYSLDLTDARCHGSSLGLAAAVGMHDAKQNIATDPYTAFTGEVNLVGQEWTIQSISGVIEKLAAARRSGCRRVFIPRSNLPDVTHTVGLRISGVDSLIDLFLQLRPNRPLLPSRSLQGRKVAALQRYCLDHGWDLPEPQPIQAGIQFNIVPLEIPLLKVQIYNSGKHTPKEPPQREYEELLSLMEEIDQPQIPIRSVNRKLTVQNFKLQQQIQEELQKLIPTESRSEQYCRYSLKFRAGEETLTVKQYTNGTLLLQGSAGPLYKSVLEAIVPLYKAHFSKSDTSVESLLDLSVSKAAERGRSPSIEISEVPLPHIGTDESGKGDYFGPLVIAGVLVDSSGCELLNCDVGKRIGRSKILPCAAFDIFCILLQQAFINLALDIRPHHGPLLINGGISKTLRRKDTPCLNHSRKVSGR